MKSIELYKSYQLKLNKLDTEDNIDISPGEFVLIYNEVQNKWFESKFKDKSTRYIDEVEQLIESNFKLKKHKDYTDYVEFNLPLNYFDYIRSYSEATRSSCANRIIYNNEVKLANLSFYLKDKYNSPSFEYQETLITLSGGKLQVYRTDFSIDSVFCTYYRYPVQIDIEGYTKNGVLSQNVDPELRNHQIDEVIDMCVTETQRRYSDIEGYQLSQIREQINNK